MIARLGAAAAAAVALSGCLPTIPAPEPVFAPRPGGQGARIVDGALAIEVLGVAVARPYETRLEVDVKVTNTGNQVEVWSPDDVVLRVLATGKEYHHTNTIDDQPAYTPPGLVEIPLVAFSNPLRPGASLSATLSYFSGWSPDDPNARGFNLGSAGKIAISYHQKVVEVP